MTRSLACRALIMAGSTYSDMIIDILVEDNATPVKRVKVHIESVDFTIPMIIDNDKHTGSALCFSCTVRFHSIKPRRVCSDVNSRCEIDLGTVVGVQLGNIIKRQGRWIARYGFVIDLGYSVGKLGCRVARKVCLGGVEPNNRCCKVSGLYSRTIAMELLHTVSGNKIRNSRCLSFFKERFKERGWKSGSLCNIIVG